MSEVTIPTLANPEQCPAYQLPPWTHHQVTTLQVFCRTERLAALDKWVPRPMRRRGEGVFAVVFMELPSIDELGPQYRSIESGIAIPIELENGRTGSTWAVMFVDNDIAQVAGREIWGHPKKLADLRVDLNGSHCTGEVRHFPYRDPEARVLYQVAATIDGSHPEAMEWARTFERRIQKRVFPSPFLDRSGSEELVRVIISDAAIHSEETGSAEVELVESSEGLEELIPIDVLGAHRRVADFVLWQGKPAY